MRIWLLILTGCIMFWLCAYFAIASLIKTRTDELISYVDGMSLSARDEMCEVWTQDRIAVLESLQALSGASIRDAVYVAGLTCSRERT